MTFTGDIQKYFMLFCFLIAFLEYANDLLILSFLVLGSLQAIPEESNSFTRNLNAVEECWDFPVGWPVSMGSLPLTGAWRLMLACFISAAELVN